MAMNPWQWLVAFLLLATASQAVRADLVEDINRPPSPKQDPVVLEPSGGPGSKPAASGNLYPPKGAEGTDPPPSMQAPVASPTRDPKTLKPKSKPKTPTGPAEPDNSKEPIHFQSQGARGSKESGLLELLEDVVITQGNLTLKSQKARLYYDNDASVVERVIAIGNVIITRSDPDPSQRVKATSDTATFYNIERKVELEGNAQLNRGGDEFTGKKIIYEVDSGWIRADKVRGMVTPGDEATRQGKTRGNNPK